ncbi:MAG: CAP domain-containing protein [Candidatus Parabeggiatoa sp.]|nr:CAP domain-containing protein [Candidatus Parabeggiatoa sp.]
MTDYKTLALVCVMMIQGCGFGGYFKKAPPHAVNATDFIEWQSASVAPVVSARPNAPVQPARQGIADNGSRLSSQDMQGLLNFHNQSRAAVGVGGLQWSWKLAGYAQSWADHLAGSGCRMQHRQGDNYGENLFMGTVGYYNAVEAAKSWDTEKQYYRGQALSSSNWYASGHYTQMVWRDTRYMGCGQSQCNGSLIVVCNYDPPGNYMGRRPY